MASMGIFHIDLVPFKISRPRKVPAKVSVGSDWVDSKPEYVRNLICIWIKILL